MSTYRKSMPYRKARTYRGTEEAPQVSGFGNATTYRGAWAQPEGQQRATRLMSHAVTPRAEMLRSPFDDLQRHNRTRRFLWRGPDTHDHVLRARWDAIAPGARTITAPIPFIPPGDRVATARWADFDGQHARDTAASWSAQPSAHGNATAVNWGQMSARSRAVALLWHSLIQQGAYVALPWGPIAARQAGVRIEWPVEPDPHPGAIPVPILPVYVMLPTLTAVRLPERTPIPLLGISLQGELGSWAWSFSAPMAASGSSLLSAPGGAPTEIEVAINGYVWTFIVDGYDDNRRFGSRTLTLRGRSRSALLAEPHAPRRTYTEPTAKLAQQLAAGELVNTGWTLLWDAVDWLVPGGTFSYQDLAPIDAIAQVANAIGAAVLSDPADKALRVAPLYDGNPWAWGVQTPYAILPASILTQGDGSWQGGVNADGVYVYAENAASGALVKITGTAGAEQLPMIVERLAVHADAQRERGRSALASAGIKKRVGRTVPLFPTPPPAGQPDLGVIPLGAMLEVQDTDETWRGQVMAIRIDAQRSGSALSVRQHLTIERQYR